MKVILMQDVKGLGKKDSLVEVSDGYARNFLFKKSLALEASAENLNTVKTRSAAQKAAEERALEGARQLGAKLTKETVHIQMKTGEGGRLYGALTSQEIADTLQKMGYPVQKKNVQLNQNLKQVGRVTVQVKLHNQVKVDVPVVVEAL